MRVLIVSMALLLPALGACSAETPSTTGGDLAAGSACEKYSSWALDYIGGVLSDSESRDAVKSFNNDAQKSQSAAIKSDARFLLAAVTTGTAASISRGMSDMTRDCLALP